MSESITWQRLTSQEVLERMSRIDVPFNDYGYDQLGFLVTTGGLSNSFL